MNQNGNQNAYTFDFFILFEENNGKDTRYADKIVDYLENEHNLKGYMETRNGTPGQSVFKNFEYALKNSQFVLLLISMESIKDGWWGRQMETTLCHYINSHQDRVVPVYLPGLNIVNLPAALSIFTGVRYDDDPRSQFWRKLSRVFE